MTQHLHAGELEEQLAKVEDRRDPPVPVVVRLLLDGAEHEAELHGWSSDPNGANDGWRGLVFLVREYAPGFGAEALMWTRAENIRQV